jgi:hypothetical protein
MQFGSPLPITGNGREEHQTVVSFIAENLARWQAATAR